MKDILMLGFRQTRVPKNGANSYGVGVYLSPEDYPRIRYDVISFTAIIPFNDLFNCYSTSQSYQSFILLSLYRYTYFSIYHLFSCAIIASIGINHFCTCSYMIRLDIILCFCIIHRYLSIHLVPFECNTLSLVY